jgi:Reverse transcriptase (RNA-dependent DNA polymerase)
MSEMANVRVPFQVFDGERKQLPPGYQEIKCHMIFDVKLDKNFRKKARFVAGGHAADPPSSITYSSVVSRVLVCIALLIAALHDLEVLSADFQNSYLHARCQEKIWTKDGPEFGSDEGSAMIIVCALHGVKSSGAAFWFLQANQLYGIGYKSTKGDPNVLICPAVKHDGYEFYDMVLVYVADIFVIPHKPLKTFNGIQENFEFKNDEVKPPAMYLGAKLEYHVFNGIKCLTMSSDKYINPFIENIEKKLKAES